MKKQELTYKSSGVDYESMDPLKRAAQLAARGTAENLTRFGFKEIPASRGESAYVFDMGPFYGAVTPEGLGTKNLVADEMERLTGKEYYSTIAKDTVATIANDLITVGAQPVVITPHWAAGSTEWFQNTKRYQALINGWAEACNEIGATYGGGETSTLINIVYPNTIELSGSGFGIIHPKERLTLGRKLRTDDHILLVESNGIHANGLTLARNIASLLPKGYLTQLPSGATFGDALLKPTHLYAKLQQALFEQQVDIHYMANITGHGWKKLMRSNVPFMYRMHTLPLPQEEFLLMQDVGPVTDEEAYGNFNMGAGFAFYMPESDIAKAQEIAQHQGFQSWDAGIVEEGSKQVIIEPKRIVFQEESLQIR